jgi:serine/threonine-protein kinase
MDAELARVARGLAVSDETEAAATMVLAGAGTAAPTTIMRPPTPLAPSRVVTDRYDYYEEPVVRGRPIWPWLLALGLILSAAVAGWYVWTQIQDQLNASKPVSVPLVVNLTEDAAKFQLEQADLKAKVQFKAYLNVPRGTVAAQDPEAGTRTAKGNTITIFVSNGKPKTKVPDVVGEDAADATVALTQANLKYHIVEINSPKEANSVLATAPGAGAVVTYGTDVRVNVSKGPKPVTVPDVREQPFENATSALQGAGFAVKSRQVDSDEPKGTVVATDPAPGSAVAPNSIVTISISKGPKAVEVPDVTGFNESDATSELQEAGFQVQSGTTPTTDPALDGAVMSQDPLAGTRAKPGSTVTILVGSLEEAPPPGETTTTAP